MTLTALDATPALVVVDLQKGTVTAPVVHPSHEIIDRAARLARGFRTSGLPVTLVNAAGVAPGRTEVPRRNSAPPPDWTDLVPELDVQPDDYLVTKYRWGAFYDTGLHEHLQQRGVTQIVLAGVATSIGVESTARAAYEHGYHVVLATDAMTDLDADAHRNSVERIFPRLGETATTNDILEMLARRRG